ncbi:hypothetical protein TNCV_4410461 [Trichonephila clavipes]|nr:hypothetical protein TNCV_4410461 [Trichonephila clavipes]
MWFLSIETDLGGFFSQHCLGISQHIRNVMLFATIDQSQLGRDFTQNYPSIILNRFFSIRAVLISAVEELGRQFPVILWFSTSGLPD